MANISTDDQGITMTYRSVIVLVMTIFLVACGGPEERKAKYRSLAQE